MFVYDYAGGTYHNFNLAWFFNCPDIIELVHVKGDIFNWHMHGSLDEKGVLNQHRSYVAEMPMTEVLRAFCARERKYHGRYSACKAKEERLKVKQDYENKLS